MNDCINNENHDNPNKPKHGLYKFKVRENVYETEKQYITGHEVCEIAGLIPPEKYKLDLKMHGNQYREVKLDDPINLEEPGIEKFTYITRDQHEG